MKHLVIAALNGEDTTWVEQVSVDWAPSIFKRFRPSGREAFAILANIISLYHRANDHDEFVFAQGNPFDHAPSFIQDLNDDLIRVYGNVWSCDYESAPDYNAPLNSWCDVFGLPRQATFRFIMGAQFRVTGSQIKARPIEFYRAMLSLTGVNPQVPWIYERLWPSVFGLELERRQPAITQLEDATP